MAGTLKQYFSNENYQIYPHDYFFAKNLLTGERQITGNTFAVDHSASDYISSAALKRREFYRFIVRTFGEKHIITRIILGLKDIVWRINPARLMYSLFH